MDVLYVAQPSEDVAGVIGVGGSGVTFELTLHLTHTNTQKDIR